VDFCLVGSCRDFRLGVDQLAAARNGWSADVAKYIEASHVGRARGKGHFQTVREIRSKK